MGGKFHLKLNNGKKPIANKYREGKMQRTLKRELKVLEIVKREGDSTSGVLRFIVAVALQPLLRVVVLVNMSFVSWDNCHWEVTMLLGV
jgi:hypothetical protein